MIQKTAFQEGPDNHRLPSSDSGSGIVDVTLDETKPEYPALVIDGSGTTTFVGLLGDSESWLHWEVSDSAPLEGLFPTVESALGKTGVPLRSIRALVYCEGPGSVLGLRLCAMAVETWSRLFETVGQLYAYNSLTLAASALLRSKPDLEHARLISDWRKDLWNSVAIHNRAIGPVEAIGLDDISPDATLYHLPARKGWQAPPDRATKLEAAPQHIADLLETPGLLRRTRGVELFNTGANRFQKWTAERHRG